MNMNMNKKHKLKKIAEDKLREYLEEYENRENEEDIKSSTNTAQNEQRTHRKTSMD